MTEPNAHDIWYESGNRQSDQDEQDWLRAEQDEQDWLRAEQENLARSDKGTLDHHPARRSVATSADSDPPA
jgi:hypothetical protein